MIRQDERRQRRLAQSVALSGRSWEHDGLHRGIGAEPLEDVREERVPVAVVERDLGRRAHDGEHAAQFVSGASRPSSSSTPRSGEKPER